MLAPVRLAAWAFLAAAAIGAAQWATVFLALKGYSLQTVLTSAVLGSAAVLLTSAAHCVARARGLPPPGPRPMELELFARASDAEEGPARGPPARI